MDEALRAWVEATAGGPITHVTRPPNGGSRELYFVDVAATAGAVVRLVLRCEGGGSFAGTEISPAKEAVVYRALERTPVPVPHVVGLAPGGAALLMERVPGAGDFSEVDGCRARRDDGVVRRRTRGVAQPRRRRTRTRRFRAATRRGGPRPSRSRDVGEARGRRRAAPRSIGALRRRVAARAGSRDVARTVLVQGDTGPATSCSRTGRSRGSSTGSSRTSATRWTTGHGSTCECPMPTSPSSRTGTPRATGIAIDHERIRYYRAAVDYRCAVTTSLAVARGGGARGMGAIPARDRALRARARRSPVGAPRHVGDHSTAGRGAHRAHPLLRPSARRDPRRHPGDRRRRAAREHAEPPDPGALPPRLRRDRRPDRGARPRRPRRDARNRRARRVALRPRSSNTPAPMPTSTCSATCSGVHNATAGCGQPCSTALAIDTQPASSAGADSTGGRDKLVREVRCAGLRGAGGRSTGSGRAAREDRGRPIRR